MINANLICNKAINFTSLFCYSVDHYKIWGPDLLLHTDLFCNGGYIKAERYWGVEHDPALSSLYVGFKATKVAGHSYFIRNVVQICHSCHFKSHHKGAVVYQGDGSRGGVVVHARWLLLLGARLLKTLTQQTYGLCSLWALIINTGGQRKAGQLCVLRAVLL